MAEETTELGIPDEFFVFVTRTSLATRHNYDLTGGFASRCAELLATAEGAQKYDSGEIDLLPFKQNLEQYPDLSIFPIGVMADRRRGPHLVASLDRVRGSSA